MQESHNSSVLAMELCLSCTNPLIRALVKRVITLSGNDFWTGVCQAITEKSEKVPTYGQLNAWDQEHLGTLFVET